MSFLTCLVSMLWNANNSLDPLQRLYISWGTWKLLWVHSLWVWLDCCSPHKITLHMFIMSTLFIIGNWNIIQMRKRSLVYRQVRPLTTKKQQLYL